MRYVLSGLGLLLTLGFLSLAAAADDTKDKDSSSNKTTKSADKDSKTGYSEKKAKAGEPFTAKLLQVEGAQRYFNVEVSWKTPKENAGAAQNIANLQRQLVGNRDPNSIRSIYTQITQNQQNLVTYKDEKKKLELSAVDEIVVRTMLPPVEYDDKGKVKKLTPKEIKALKGPDPSLPGFPADFDSLKPNKKVKIYLLKSKESSRTKSADKDETKAKEKPKVKMIVIVSEPVK
jgi:hypothetical protein